MVSISDLLKYKEEVELINPTTKKPIATVWVKLMGDEALKDAYKFARIKSAQMRAQLRDTASQEHELHITSLEEQDEKDLHTLVVAAKSNDFTRESVAVVAREELPQLDEIALEPDAPRLEEQEVLDKKENETEQRFLDKINEYVEARKTELLAELKKASKKKIIEMAKEEMVSIVAQDSFVKELNDQKVFRGTFTDKECKVKAFKSIDEYRDTHSEIKQQLLDAYNKLEIEPDDIKN